MKRVWEWLLQFDDRYLLVAVFYGVPFAVAIHEAVKQLLK